MKETLVILEVQDVNSCAMIEIDERFPCFEMFLLAKTVDNVQDAASNIIVRDVTGAICYSLWSEML